MLDSTLSTPRDMPLPDGAEPADFSAFNPFGRPEVPNVTDTVADRAKQIEWASSLQDGINQAQKEGKPLICVFEESQCGWCDKFEKELTKPAASGLGEKAIFVRIRPSQDADGKRLADNLGIDSYPTVSVLDISATKINERTRMVGFMTADDFAMRLQPSASALV